MTITRSLLCHMNIVLEDGSTADSTKASGKPARLNVGDGTLSPAFEAQLADLYEGTNTVLPSKRLMLLVNLILMLSIIWIEAVSLRIWTWKLE